jgi:hypothetical protein
LYGPRFVGIVSNDNNQEKDIHPYNYPSKFLSLIPFPMCLGCFLRDRAKHETPNQNRSGQGRESPEQNLTLDEPGDTAGIAHRGNDPGGCGHQALGRGDPFRLIGLEE